MADDGSNGVRQSLPAGDEVLLVMADGSSTRTPKAPGGLHEGAEAYDAAVVEALRSGDPAALGAGCRARRSAERVGAGGAATWRAAAQLLAGRTPTGARVLAADAPYGVGSPVALWTW